MSTQSAGSTLMRRGRPKVSTTDWVSMPTTSILLDFGFAVGFDAELDRHAEEIEILLISPMVRKPLLLPSL